MKPVPLLMGVILCGGNSSRMGRDKGLILKDGIPWARHMADKLLQLDIPVVFSINPGQADTYAAALPDIRLVVDHVEIAGPLRGLLSVHAEYPDRDLLLVACDMPDLDHATISHLVNVYRADRDYDLYAFRGSEFFEPFCAIYTARSLAGERKERSLQHLLREGKTKTLSILNTEAFRNYNTL